MRAVARLSDWVLVLGALLFALFSSAGAQPAKKTPRIGLLLTNSSSSESSRAEAFRQELRRLGYIEGQNIRIDDRYGDGKLDRLPKLATDLVELKVDVIVTSGAPPTRAAQQASKTIPIVMTVVGDPIAAGFITSLAKPGGNITGLTQLSRELSGKRLEVLKEAFPKVSRVGVFVDAQGMGSSLEETQLAAEPLGITPIPVEIKEGLDLEAAFKKVKSQRADALIFLPGPVLTGHRKQIVELTLRSRLPAIYTTEFVEVGGLITYGPNYDDLYRRAAVYVDKILKGAKAADLPVEQPKTFELVVNLKTAKQIGLTIPPNVLARADRVIR